jgi:hypothetical protein
MIQGGSNMTGTNCDLFTHKSSRSYLNHLVKLRTGYHIGTWMELAQDHVQWWWPSVLAVLTLQVLCR